MLASNPKISVIIPAYNVEAYIGECLDSVFAQTYLPYEVIVVDDGSSDATYKRVSAYKQDHPVIIKLLTQENSGQGTARNRALRVAKGDFILFLDADDSIEEGLFSALHALLSSGTLPDIFHFNWQRFEEAGGRRVYTVIDDDEVAHESKLTGSNCDKMLQITNYFSANNIFRRRFLVDNSIYYGSGSLYEDNIFMVQAITNANLICNTSKVYYNYRHHSGQSTKYSGDDAKHYHAFIDAIDAMIKHCQPRTTHTAYYLLRYSVSKFLVYIETRVPRRFHRNFARDFVRMFHALDVTPDTSSRNIFLTICLRLRIFSNNRYRLFLWLSLAKVTYAQLRRRI